MKQIFSALVKAQKAFGPALKSATNPHFRSKYADLSAVVEAVIDGLNNAGIALIQASHECPDGVIVETIFIHESGEQFSAGKLHVPASKKDAQGYGSALTYARRYGLMAACGIAPEDDDGNAASKRSPVIRALPVVELPADQQNYIADLAAQCQELVSGGRASEASAAVDAEQLDNDQKIALWGMLDSRTRSAMKSASRVAA